MVSIFLGRIETEKGWAFLVLFWATPGASDLCNKRFSEGGSEGGVFSASYSEESGEDSMGPCRIREQNSLSSHHGDR